MAKMSREDAWRELIQKQDRPEWMLREWLHFVGWGNEDAGDLLDDFYDFILYPDPLHQWALRSNITV